MSEETELLYLRGIEGSYVKDVEVNVLGYEEGGYILDKTNMHYQGGGQPGDRGLLVAGEVRIPIYNVKKRGRNVLHLSAELKDVDKGKLILDWERRYRIMRMHTLQHAISAVFYKEGYQSLVTQVFPGYGYTEGDSKANKIPDEAFKLGETSRNVKRFDIGREEIDPKLLARCNLEKLPKSLKTVSIVEIENLDVCACAGTHVKNTLEIGKYWLRTPGNRIEFGLF